MWSEKQKKKIQKILSYAKNSSSYYSKVLRDIDIENIDETEFKKIEILDKFIYRSQYDSLLPINFEEMQVQYETTSGSSGIPMKIPRTNLDRIRLSLPLTKVRSTWLKEIPHIQRSANFSHRINDVTENNVGGWLGLWLRELNDENLKIQCDKIMEFKPQTLAGPPQALEMLASYIVKNGVKIQEAGIKLIECRAEYLFENQRKICEKAFECPVVNMYGCHEVWGIAYECREHKLHILEDSVYLEIVNEKNESLNCGEIGDVVITGLCEQTIPFIRYKLGDKAILREDSCACGAKEKYIDLIGTRNTDWISTPNGKICTTVLTPIVSLFSKGNYEFVDQFQIVQNDIKEFALYIATKQSIPNEFKTHIHNLLCEIIGYPIQLDFFINEEFHVNKNSLKMSWFFNKLL